MARQSRRAWLLDAIVDQMSWIKSCGGSLLGYIQKYGDPGIPPLGDDGEFKTMSLPPEKHFTGKSALVPVPNVPNTFYFPHSGNGGSAIYKADLHELRRLEELAGI